MSRYTFSDMTGTIDGAGDIVTGSLLSESLAPSHPLGAHGGLCLNCGTPLTGEFCHACGQNGHVHRTIGSIGHDIAHGVFHFEGRIWRTLPVLVRHPGSRTRRYIVGERARFAPPLALFLFTVFPMFATINTLSGGIGTLGEALNRGSARRTGTLARIDNEIARWKRQRADLLAKANPPATPARIAALGNIDRPIASLGRAERTIKSMNDPALDHHIDTGWLRLDDGIARARADPLSCFISCNRTVTNTAGR